MSTVPIPGTVRMVDLDGVSNLQHGKDNKDIILIPQPTKHPDDPLNWSPKRRLNSSIWQVIWAFFGAGFINGLTPAYLLIQEDTGISIADINTGNGLMYLFFGFGNLITQPLALNYGRRPAAVISILVTSFLVLWSSYMKNAAEWYANRILIGIFYSGIECLIELCITDTKFIHERGFHMGFYNWSLFGGPFLAPIPAGFLADAAGWRWINRMYFFVGLAVSIGCFFFFEETMFYRPHVAQEFIDMDQNATGEKLDPTNSRDKTSNPAETSAVEELGETFVTKTYLQRLKLWGHRDPRQPNTFIKNFWLPFYLFKYPSIVFSGILVGSVLSWFNVLLGTIATVFGSVPYNFSTNMIGLTYLACLIGTTVGCLIAGDLNDRLAMIMARRNGGVKEPEARLWAALVPFILHPAGCILYGVGAAHEIHWVGLCFGIGLVTLAIVMGSTLALSYTIDCYKEIAGVALITVIIIRNCMGKFAKNSGSFRMLSDNLSQVSLSRML